MKRQVQRANQKLAEVALEIDAVLSITEIHEKCCGKLPTNFYTSMCLIMGLCWMYFNGTLNKGIGAGVFDLGKVKIEFLLFLIAERVSYQGWYLNAAHVGPHFRKTNPAFFRIIYYLPHFPALFGVFRI